MYVNDKGSPTTSLGATVLGDLQKQELVLTETHLKVQLREGVSLDK